MNAPQPHRAAASTVEALMYSLRFGVQALDKHETLGRLRELSDEQMREVAVRVQRFQSHIAPAWKTEDVEVLILLRSKALENA
jgi:hypothetical protein